MNEKQLAKLKEESYEKWYYEVYVKKCYANDCWGCDDCVPYEETMEGRLQMHEALEKETEEAETPKEVKPEIKYDYKLRSYVDVANGRLIK